MAALFAAADLAAAPFYLTVSDEDTAALEQLVWGWLSGATGLPSRPDTVTDDLKAWALELAAMAYDNPTGLSQRQVDDVVFGSSEERRNAILEAAARASDVTSTGEAQGCFPAPCGWPDPIQPFVTWVNW